MVYGSGFRFKFGIVVDLWRVFYTGLYKGLPKGL